MKNIKNRFLGIALSAAMLAELLSTSLPTTVNAGIFSLGKSDYYSAETRKNDDSVYCEGFNDYSSGVMSIEIDQAKLIANDYIGFINNDVETSDGMQKRSPYRRFYVSTYGLDAEESEKRADDFKEKIADINDIYGENSIAYEADQMSSAASSNLFSAGYVASNLNLDLSKLPAMLSAKKKRSIN